MANSVPPDSMTICLYRYLSNCIFNRFVIVFWNEKTRFLTKSPIFDMDAFFCGEQLNMGDNDSPTFVCGNCLGVEEIWSTKLVSFEGSST